MIDYEVRVSFDYPRLTYEIIIPSNGEFPATGKGWGPSPGWGPNPIRIPATVNCAAVLEIVGQGVDQKPINQTNHPTSQSPTPSGRSLPFNQLPESTPRGKPAMPRRNKTIPAFRRHSRDPYPVPWVANANQDIERQYQPCQSCRIRGIDCIRSSPEKSCVQCRK